MAIAPQSTIEDPVPGFTYSSGNPDLYNATVGGKHEFFAPRSFAPGEGFASIDPAAATRSGGTPYTDPYAEFLFSSRQATADAWQRQHASGENAPGNAPTAQYDLPYSPSGYVFDTPPANVNALYRYQPGEKGGSDLRDALMVAGMATPLALGELGVFGEAVGAGAGGVSAAPSALSTQLLGDTASTGFSTAGIAGSDIGAAGIGGTVGAAEAGAMSAEASDAGMLPTPGNQATGIDPATGQPITAAAGLPGDPAAAADVLTAQIADLTAFENVTTGFPTLADVGGGTPGGLPFATDLGAFGDYNAFAAADTGTATTDVGDYSTLTQPTSGTSTITGPDLGGVTGGTLSPNDPFAPPASLSTQGGTGLSATEPSGTGLAPKAAGSSFTPAVHAGSSGGGVGAFLGKNWAPLASLGLTGAAIAQNRMGAPGSKALNKVSGPAIAQGQQLVAQAAAGKLTASQQTALDAWVKQQKAQAAQFAQNAYGSSSSTMQQQMMEQIDAQAEVMKQQILQNTFKQGFDLLGLGNADQQQLAELQFNANAQLQQQMQNALAALGRIQGGGGNISVNVTQA